MDSDTTLAAAAARDLADAPGLPDVPGYRVVRRLGVGAHAQVWLAEELASGSRVAVKVAHDLAAGDGDRLAGEADLLERMRHDHVVRLQARVRLPDGSLALVLDDAAGGSLADVIATRGRLRPGEVTTVVVAVARALTVLHDAGIVHGDVSAGNVLFTADGRPMLADLGVAADHAAGATGVSGTPGWADPRNGPGRAADVWALGVLIRFCLTGSTAEGTAPASAEPSGLRLDAATKAMLELARTCCLTTVLERPSPAGVARGAWRACPPRSVALVDPSAVSAARPRVSRPQPTRRVRPLPVAQDRPARARRAPRLLYLAAGLTALLILAAVTLSVVPVWSAGSARLGQPAGGAVQVGMTEAEPAALQHFR